MKKKLVTSLLAVTMLGTCLTGCGGGASQSTGTAATSAAAGAAAAQTSAGTAASAAAGAVQNADGSWSQAYKGTKLTFMDVAPGDVRTAYFQQLFKDFQKDTGIEVEYQSVPWDDAANKMTVLGSSGSLPDVMTVWSGWLGQYTEAGWVEPLTDYIGDSTSDYTDAVSKLIWASEKTRYGNIYTLPDGLMVKGIYVRKDWCEAAGIKLDPTKAWTYDDYFDLVAKLTDASQNHYGASYRGARGALDPLWVYMQGYTGGATYDQDGKILMDSDDCLKAFTKWTDIYKNGYAPKDAINWGFTEMVDNFVGGLTGTLINDSEVAATLIAKMDDSQWMVMPMPTSEKDGKIYNTINAPYSYSMSATSKNKEAAWELMSYMTSSDKQADYCQKTGEIPIKKDASNIADYGADGHYGVFIQEMNDPTLAVPATYGAFDYTDLHQNLFHEEIQSYLLGDEDAATALKNICDALQEREDQYRKDNPDSQVETALTMQ
ncbi:MAG: sugar ABC transporter substrate-binding protein [Lachnospiraceae bacterium]|jgi:multiple sugar transport system substrate-binding protein|nr:sugar ABC transporter substrate-binding protein [Lachnospiraceae bacterium]